MKTNRSQKLKSPNHKPQVWWNDKCSKAIQARRKAIKDYQRNATPRNFRVYQEACERAEEILKQEKQASWNAYTETIQPGQPMTGVWRMAKNYANRHGQSNQGEKGGWIEEFPNKFSPDDVSNFQQETPNFNTSPEVLQRPFSGLEMETVLKDASKKSAPGLDGVTYKMIQKLPPVAKEILLKIFNNIWAGWEMPEEWKKSILIPILKPGKNPSLADS